MHVKKPKKQCPYNVGVECDEDDECECCGWNPAGRSRKRAQKKRKYTRHPGPKIKEPGKKEHRKMQANNTSGHTGVYWNGSRKKWSAEIRIKGKRHYLGSFEDLEDAVSARKEAEERMLVEDN